MNLPPSNSADHSAEGEPVKGAWSRHAVPALPGVPHWLAVLLFVLAAAAVWWVSPAPGLPRFALPQASEDAAANPALPPAFVAEMLPAAGDSAHAASLARLPDGRMAAVWFAGSREGAADVAIWFSVLEKRGWSAPEALATRESTAGATFSYVRKLGNPVLAVLRGQLHLWFVSAAVGGWAGSAINHMVFDPSVDQWSKPERLTTSPLFNISTLVRTPPLPLADGGFALPVYHEFIAKFGQWLRFDASGRLVDLVRMPQSAPALQPAVAALDGQRAIAALRDAGPGPGQVRFSVTGDAGLHWLPLSGAEAPAVPNPNASVALLRLASGRLLLAGNPGEGRMALNLWLSDDEGRHWRLARTVESAPDGGAEFSYPALLLAPDGGIHLAYTWRRQGIRHAFFTEAWLDGIGERERGAQP